jgi:ABC-2 type transport system ATP-binding protein
MSTSHQHASIVVSDLVKVYDPSPRWMSLLVRSNLKSSVTAVSGISFEVQPGEICVVLGPNGAGKTTTFRVLVGLTTPTSGSATVMGYNADTEAVSVRKMVGWMPSDQRALLMRHSVNENLRFHGQLQGMERDELKKAIEETLELVGLDGWGTSTCFALSTGMKARLQLARALLHKPSVLILDEPTGAVDPVASHELVHLIRDIVSERQIAALISSHRLEEIETLHSRVLLLDEGRVRYDGELGTLRNKYAGPRLSIQFRTSDSAAEAGLALKTANVGVVSNLGDTGIVCELNPDVTHATVLSILQEQTEDIVSLQESETPLHAILANVYKDKQRSPE